MRTFGAGPVLDGENKTSLLLLTPSFSWVCNNTGDRNRFNGFFQSRETVKTVPLPSTTPCTPLKRGVNEKWFGTYSAVRVPRSAL